MQTATATETKFKPILQQHQKSIVHPLSRSQERVARTILNNLKRGVQPYKTIIRNPEGNRHIKTQENFPTKERDLEVLTVWLQIFKAQFFLSMFDFSRKGETIPPEEKISLTSFCYFCNKNGMDVFTTVCLKEEGISFDLSIKSKKPLQQGEIMN